MTRLAIALLAGFAAGALVWAIWSIVERVLAGRFSAPSSPANEGSAERKGETDAEAGAE